MRSAPGSITILFALLLAQLLASCINFEWKRETGLRPIPDAVIADLRPGVDLGTCLDSLGAPLFAWEDNTNGMALAWGWHHSDDKGFAASVPVGRANASFDYNRIRTNTRGLVLFFDAEDTLTSSRRGYLREIAPEEYRRRSSLQE